MSSWWVVAYVMIRIVHSLSNTPQLVLGKSYSSMNQQFVNNNAFVLPIESMINNKSSKNITFFSKNQSNHINIQFYSSEQKYDGIPTTNMVYIQIHNQNYGKIITIDLEIGKYWNTTLTKWKGQQLALAHLHHGTHKQLVKFEIIINFEIQHILRTQQASTVRDRDQLIRIKLQSNSFQLATLLSHTTYGYTHLLFIIQTIYAFIILYRYQIQREQKRKIINTSQWFLIQNIFFLLYSAIFQIGLCYHKFDSQLKWIFYAALWNLATLVLFMIKFQATLQKLITRKSLCFAFLQILISMIIFILTDNLYRFWAIEASTIFLWQITYSMRRGGAGGLPSTLTELTINIRIPFLYLLSFEETILKLNPSLRLGLLIILAWLIQLSIIKRQQQKGGRCMIPNCIKPDYYNYYFTMGTEDQRISHDCAICLLKFNENPQGKQNQTVVNQPSEHFIRISLEKLHQDVKLMKTPCQHIFHIQCLKNWIEVKVKAICPLCRTQLPPLDFLQ